MPQKTKKQKIQSKQRRMTMKQQNITHDDIHNTSFKSPSHQPMTSPIVFSFNRHSSSNQTHQIEDTLFPAEQEITKTVIVSVATIVAVVLVSFAL